MVIGKASDIQRDYNDPSKYRITLKQIRVTAARSYYVYFESDKPLLVRQARFGDKRFALSEDKLIQEGQ